MSETAPSPGQIAYAEWASNVNNYPTTPWLVLRADVADMWEDIAEAVLTALDKGEIERDAF